MRKIIAYELCLLILVSLLYILQHLFALPAWYINNILMINCGITGALGGILYCLRSIYLNKCVHKQWDKEWEIWYYLRPITSLICGFISFIFLKAGLLFLDAPPNDGNNYGYIAVAFLAGYSVDNFLKKMKEIMQSIWGIKEN